ncbi:MAG: DUF4412 domain-containing protein [Candidatus Aminicenantaceae bacterium]
MTNKKTLWILISIFAFILFLLPTNTKADILIKKVKHTDEAIDKTGKTQPAKDEQGITWIAKNKMRDDMSETSMIVRYDLKKIYIIDHSKKAYSEADIPINLEKVLPPETKQMMQMLQVATKFTATDETQKIKSWTCKKYIVEITVSMMGMNMPITMEIWATKDLGIDLKTFHNLYGTILSTTPFTEGLAKEFKKMEGYPILILYSMVMSGSETKSREEVVSVEKKDAPAGTYDLPQGYKKIPFNPLGQDSK